MGVVWLLSLGDGGVIFTGIRSSVKANLTYRLSFGVPSVLMPVDVGRMTSVRLPAASYRNCVMHTPTPPGNGSGAGGTGHWAVWASGVPPTSWATDASYRGSHCLMGRPLAS